MPELLNSGEIDRFFRVGFEHTAWRLEPRRAYQVDYESEPYQRFLRGEDPARDPDRPWLANMRKQTSLGKRVERVRLIDDPPTAYQRYGLTGVPAALEAGEDVRYLPRSRAGQLGLPLEDFWLFDSRYAARFHYEGDRAIGLEVVEDPVRVLAYCQIRDAAWHYAVPYARIGELVPSGV
ncbi:DUF6879 family protein [Streptomyces sp. NPDC052396]|uniref:DUF6879 family protein n=1 Tax=Streptomyces sp. NPDC052396 TaxID=3365689 RepID=UPI0037D664DF